MNSRIIFIGSEGDFSASDKRKLSASARKVFRDASRQLGTDKPVTATFHRAGSKNSGYTQAKDWIAVTVPEGKTDLIDLEAMLYHEMHHIARGYNGYRGKFYLLDTVLSEGLATDFEAANADPGRKMTHHEYDQDLIDKWLPEMIRDMDDADYDYPAWFQGKGKPKQLGYKLGKYLVDQVRKNHPELSRKDMATMDARKLLKMSGMHSY